MWSDLTPERRIEIIEQGASAGLSAGQIAMQIDGATRNMVIGYASRYRIQLNGGGGRIAVNRDGQGGTGGRSHPIRMKRAKTKPKAKAEPAHTEIEPLHGIGIPFLTRRDKQCAWMINDDMKNAVCCGQPVMKGNRQPYCEAHAAVSVSEGSGWIRQERAA